MHICKKIIYIITLVAALLCGCSRDTEIETFDTENGYLEDIEVSTEEETEISTEAEYLRVYVCGAVITEGVYTLPKGSIADDALNAAGGYAEEAARGYVNLAEQVEDGQKIYFPYIGDDITMLPEISEGNGLININTADKELLMTLPGIGESKAMSIINYREKNGGYKSIDEIKNISGIKDRVFEQIKDLISI